MIRRLALAVGAAALLAVMVIVAPGRWTTALANSGLPSTSSARPG